MTTKKPPLESAIQREICDWLDTQNVFFWRYNNVPVFARSNDGKMRYRAMPKYGRKGLPDIVILHKSIFYGVEVKRPGFSATPEQVAIGDAIKKAGGVYWIVHSLQEAQDFIFL
jgi:hypothetical protein